MEKKITIGSDHAGYALKMKIIPHLKELGWDVIDVGTDSEASCDYPVFADAVCKSIQNGTTKLGILICGTGIGMSMAANKHRGIRAAACSDVFSARLTRAHNDANVLCFGERVVGYGVACDLVDAFLSTEFEGGKHQRRVDLFMQLEKTEF
ncbi:MAG: ribose 5-phosphate isomerase B [Ruminococcaceae bacterium]|nr:ribose 5-phosphate isomerase B [Oscillospiraceae bacterium]